MYDQNRDINPVLREAYRRCTGSEREPVMLEVHCEHCKRLVGILFDIAAWEPIETRCGCSDCRPEWR